MTYEGTLQSTVFRDAHTTVTSSIGNTNGSYQGWSPIPFHSPFYAIAPLLVALAALPSNLVVIVIIVKSSKLHNSQGMYMLSLAFSSLGTGIVCLLFSARYALTAYGPASNVELDVGGYLFYLFLTVTILNMIALSLDKLYQIERPYNHKTGTTRSIVIISVYWVVCAILSVLPTHIVPIDNYFYTFSGATLLFVTVHRSDFSALTFTRLFFIVTLTAILVIGYGRIYYTSRKHVRRMSVSTHAVPTRRQNIKGSLTVALIILAFLILWLPMLILKMAMAKSNDLNTWSRGTELAIVWLSMSHTSINMLIYCVTYKPFKDALRLMWTTARRRNDVRRHSTSYSVVKV